MHKRSLLLVAALAAITAGIGAVAYAGTVAAGSSRSAGDLPVHTASESSDSKAVTSRLGELNNQDRVVTDISALEKYIAEQLDSIKSGSSSDSDSMRLFRTGEWLATYEPSISSSVVTNIVSRTENNKNYQHQEITAQTDGKATMKAMPISKDLSYVKLIAAEVVSGTAIVDGLDISAADEGNMNPTVRVYADNGDTRTCEVALSKSITSQKTADVYVSDVAGTLRKKFNDAALPYVVAGEGDSTLTRNTSWGAITFGANSYYTTGSKAWSSTCPVPASLCSFICFKADSASYAKGGQYTNSGGGPAFVIGKRLLAGAHHWGASLSSVYTREVMEPDGTVHTVTTTGRAWNLSEWVRNNYEDIVAEEILGSIPTDYGDLDVFETTEEVPDACVPYLLPFDVADDHFSVTNRSLYVEGVCGFSLSQANTVFPISLVSDRSYGSQYSSGYYNWRQDLRDSALNGSYWRVVVGDSSHPSFLVYGSSPIVTGLWTTPTSGPSLIRAARALEALENSNGRTGSLKVLTSSDMQTYISQ